MPDYKHCKILIIGSGPAGYTAAIYAARANLNPLLIQGLQPGGQLTITTDVENYPGFAEVVQGPWLMEQMQRQAENVGTELIADLVREVDLSKRPFSCVCDSGVSFRAEALIICTGARARWLGLPSEARYNGRGVSACATCDGFFYKGAEVCVVGGGNTAVEEALYLAGICAKVTLIHRRDTLRAEKILQDRVFDNSKIEIAWNKTVEEILGDETGVTGVRLNDTKTQKRHLLETNGVFIAIGHDPATDMFKGAVDMDQDGYIITAADSTATSIPGVFAAGDVTDRVFRQAVTAAGTGCMAALEAEKFLGGS